LDHRNPGLRWLNYYKSCPRLITPFLSKEELYLELLKRQGPQVEGRVLDSSFRATDDAREGSVTLLTLHKKDIGEALYPRVLDLLIDLIALKRSPSSPNHSYRRQ
jgi:hypothetical protein